MEYINMDSDWKKGQTVPNFESADTIFSTVDFLIFVKSESEHPGWTAGLKLEHDKRGNQSYIFFTFSV